MPSWMSTCPTSEFCICGERMHAHTVEAGTILRRDRGRIVCPSFYSRADYEQARRLSAARARIREAEAASASEERRAKRRAAAARKAARDAKNGKKPESGF